MRSQEGPPFSHSLKKKPLFPKGVVRQTSCPPLTASMGRMLKYKSSSTRLASSMIIRDAPENPRTLLSLLGKDTILLPFVIRRDKRLSSVNSGLTESRDRKSFTFLNSSADCRSEGDTSRIRLRG